MFRWLESMVYNQLLFWDALLRMLLMRLFDVSLSFFNVLVFYMGIGVCITNTSSVKE